MSGELDFLAELERVIDERRSSPSPGSYVAALVAAGEPRVAQKVGEEAVELVLATAIGTRDEQLEEAADLLFHLLVLLRTKDLRLAEVANLLEERHRASEAPG